MIRQRKAACLQELGRPVCPEVSPQVLPTFSRHSTSLFIFCSSLLSKIINQKRQVFVLCKRREGASRLLLFHGKLNYLINVLLGCDSDSFKGKLVDTQLGDSETWVQSFWHVCPQEHQEESHMWGWKINSRGFRCQSQGQSQIQDYVTAEIVHDLLIAKGSDRVIKGKGQSEGLVPITGIRFLSGAEDRRTVKNIWN